MSDHLGKDTFKLGFGLMRLPKNPDGTIDIPQVSKMADAFLEAGGTYFDTAYVYDDNTDAAELLGHLPKGTQVEVLEMDDSWCLIRYKGHQGWALREELQLVMLEDAQS